MNARGFTLIEALVAMVLTCAVLGSTWTVAVVTARSATRIADDAEAMATTRAVGWVLQEELEGATAGGDVAAPRGDSLSVRAFRGFAIVCAPAPRPEDLVVRWRGVRAPDAQKDSVLVLTSSGRWAPFRLVDRAPAPEACPGDSEGTVERWTFERPPGSAAAARFYERGTYHLGGDALRYRVGQGGRQPLSPATLVATGTGIASADSATLTVTVASRGVHVAASAIAWARSFHLPGRW